MLASVAATNPAFELPEPDLRSLQVEQDPDGAAGGVRDVTQVVVHDAMFFVGAVRQVEAGDIHAGEHELLDALAGGRGRP